MLNPSVANTFWTFWDDAFSWIEINHERKNSHTFEKEVICHFGNKKHNFNPIVEITTLFNKYCRAAVGWRFWVNKKIINFTNEPAKPVLIEPLWFVLQVTTKVKNPILDRARYYVKNNPMISRKGEK